MSTTVRQQPRREHRADPDPEHRHQLRELPLPDLGQQRLVHRVPEALDLRLLLLALLVLLRTSP